MMEKTPGLEDGGGGGVWQGPGEEEQAARNRSDEEACARGQTNQIRPEVADVAGRLTRGLARTVWNGAEEALRAFCR